jgi:hypothetical protein
MMADMGRKRSKTVTTVTRIRGEQTTKTLPAEGSVGYSSVPGVTEVPFRLPVFHGEQLELASPQESGEDGGIYDVGVAEPNRGELPLADP